MWQIKVMCLICLAGDNILSFLTVVVFIPFLPSSHGHFSHVEVQTTPRRTCSLLTDTSPVRALAWVVPTGQWANTHFIYTIKAAALPHSPRSFQKFPFPSIFSEEALFLPKVFFFPPDHSLFLNHVQPTQTAELSLHMFRPSQNCMCPKTQLKMVKLRRFFLSLTHPFLSGEPGLHAQ